MPHQIMTKTAIIGMLIILLSSCTKEAYTHIDPAEFNELIAGRTDIMNAGDLMEIYYNYPDEEGRPDISVETKRIGINKVKVTLIHDRLADDSLRSIQIIMIVKQSGSQWHVIEIMKNWRCYDGRGHTDWGIEPCK